MGSVARYTWTWIAAGVVMFSLTACGGDSLVPAVDSAGANVQRPAVNLQLIPDRVEAGETATLTWNASYAQSCSASGGWSGTQPTSGTLSTAPLRSTTQYTLTCTGVGGSAAQSAEVVVTQAAPTISLAASPTTISTGGTSTLTWSTKNATSCHAIGGWSGPVLTSGRWATAKLTNTTDFGLTCSGPGGSATQSTTVTVTDPAPEVTLKPAPSTVSAGGSAVLSWSSINATRCSASGAWSGDLSTSGSRSTGPIHTSSTFTLTCTGLGGSATQSATVSLAEAVPVVSISANPSTVPVGDSTTITWSATNATECTASGGWSGAKASSGTQSSGTVNATTTYSLTCKGPSGSSTQQSTTVSVKSPTPTVRLSVGPSAIESGASATLTWSSADATACMASGAWSGARAVKGTQSTGALTANSTYTLTCTGAGGSAAQSATVSVKASPPTVSLSATPSSLTSGGSATLRWSSTNAASCSASGAWSGAEAPQGSQSTGSLKANSTFTLACSGPGGAATQSTTVTVTPAPTATISLSANPSTVLSGGASTLTWSTTNATSCTASGAWSGTKALNGSTSTGALTASASYTLTCTGAGGSATQSTVVSVTPPQPTVAIAAGPSTITSGSSAILTWSSGNATSCMASGAWSGARPVGGSQSTGALTANETYSLTCTGPGGSGTQSATVSVTSPAPAPTVLLNASPSTVVSGGGSTLSWSTAHASTCAASGGWSGGEPVNGSQATGPLKSSTIYTLTCTGTGGSASQSVTVSVTSPAPTVTLSAAPSTIVSGNSTTLSWSSTNATSCSASGSWSGSEPLNGSVSSGALKADSTFTLTCSGSGGSASQSATVTVTTPDPTVTLNANPSTVKSGAASALSWSSTNATSCAASGGWNGSKATSGSQTTAALTTAATYTLTCTGAGGSAAQSVTVSVSAPPPSVSLSANPTSITTGSSSTLSWSSTNATSCAASGGWSGTLDASGSRSTGALSTTTTYTLSCTGAGGSATQSVTVSVTAPETGSASLSWTAPTEDTDGSALTPLSGYTIYYGTSEGSLTKSVVVSGASTLTYRMSGLTSGTWYFAVAADAEDGTQSAMSSIGSKSF